MWLINFISCSTNNETASVLPSHLLKFSVESIINKILIWYLKMQGQQRKRRTGFPNLLAVDWNLLSDSGGIRLETNIEYWIPFPMCICYWISSCVKCVFKPLVRFFIWLAPFSHWFVQVLYSFCIPFFLNFMYWIYIFSIYVAFISFFSILLVSLDERYFKL